MLRVQRSFLKHSLLGLGDVAQPGPCGARGLIPGTLKAKSFLNPVMFIMSLDFLASDMKLLSVHPLLGALGWGGGGGACRSVSAPYSEVEKSLMHACMQLGVQREGSWMEVEHRNFDLENQLHFRKCPQRFERLRRESLGRKRWELGGRSSRRSPPPCLQATEVRDEVLGA